MKMMKKVATLLLAVCLIVPCFSMLTFAAEGEIKFTDPSTAVGETLEVKGVLEADSSIEDRKIVMTYDTSMLKFKSGDSVKETASGQLTYEATGSVGGSRVEFLMKFDVLKEGTARITVEDYLAYNTSDQKLTCAKGSSTITIAAGNATTVTTDDPTTDETSTDPEAIEIDGVSYTLSENFTEEDIPEGFVESTIDYDGAQRKVVMHEVSGLYLGYLVDASGEGKFFVYVTDNATFAPYEQIDISDSTSIVLLTTVEDIVLPETYEETNVTVNGNEFPAWQNSEDTRFCILYAMNNQGEESLYQFDTAEGTYQRFEAPEIEEKDTSFIGKLSDVLQNHLDYVILGTGLGFILFVIIIIILSVKLYNRNAELDELYDEYGIDLDDEDEKKEKEPEFNFIDTSVFDDVAGETEDDVVMETSDEEEDDSEVEVEFYAQDSVSVEKAVAEATEGSADSEEVVGDTIVSDDSKNIGKEAEDDTEFFDDDEEVDFEMDFIDLDD